MLSPNLIAKSILQFRSAKIKTKIILIKMFSLFFKVFFKLLLTCALQIQFLIICVLILLTKLKKRIIVIMETERLLDDNF